MSHSTNKNIDLFDVTCDLDNAKLLIIPVPWEATVSYKRGTANAPASILRASVQVDLFDFDVKSPEISGIKLLPTPKGVSHLNNKAIEKINNDRHSPDTKKLVNTYSEKLNNLVLSETLAIINSNKIPAVLGGEHSAPFGAIKAIATKHPHFGILHIDAHADLRNSYEDFNYSHASIMNNVCNQIPEMQKLVQVGIRDFCEEEFEFIQNNKNKIQTFFDWHMFQKKSSGTTWADIGSKIISTLPDNVWISFDIDGLDPNNCPNTGTPVPGGLSFCEAEWLLRALVKSGRKIIGFDLCEVSPGENNEWDANVGARMLYKLSSLTLSSQKKAEIR